jgi:hypothetical protein
MEIKPILLHGFLLLTFFLAQPVSVEAQFNFTTNNDGTLNVSGYTGPGGTVMIPATTNGLTVTTIGQWVFLDGTSLTSVIIPDSVTSIYDDAFGFCGNLTNLVIGKSVTNIVAEAFIYCSNLTSIDIPASVISFTNDVFLGCTSLADITVDPQNQFYSSVNGVMFDKAQTTLVLFPSADGGDYTVPNGVTTIEGHSFSGCTNLISIIVPASVTNIQSLAFYQCHNPFSVYFKGALPSFGSYYPLGENVTAYYLPGTSGWGTPITDVPTALWYLPKPMILDNGPGLGSQSNKFNFTVSWATNASVEVQACTNLANPVWQVIQSGNLSNGTNYFSESQLKLLPGRFYRVRAVPY